MAKKRDWGTPDGHCDGRETTFTAENGDGYIISVTLQSNVDGVLVCSGVNIQYEDKSTSPTSPINSRFFQLLGFGEILNEVREYYIDFGNILDEVYREIDLENQLKDAQKCRFRIIVTDGVFSMDGDIALMDKICDLADKYDALVMTDECHSAGFIGKTGRGVPEYCGVLDRVDIITGTLGKALGGAMGGYTTGKKEIIDILRQRSRPYLFSNSLAPSIVGASNKVFDILSSTTELRDKLENNTAYFKKAIVEAGFDIKPGDSPIVPIMLYDAALSQKFAELLLREGVYAVGFFYPVVAKGAARIRTQISAAHTMADLDKAIAAFIKVGKELKVI